jgi:hypothetical protein
MADRASWALNLNGDGTPLQSVARGAVDLEQSCRMKTRKSREAQTSSKPIARPPQGSVKDKTSDVRATTRLVDSPACQWWKRRHVPGSAHVASWSGPGGSRSTGFGGVQAPRWSNSKPTRTCGRITVISCLTRPTAIRRRHATADPAAYVKRVNARCSLSGA